MFTLYNETTLCLFLVIRFSTSLFPGLVSSKIWIFTIVWCSYRLNAVCHPVEFVIFPPQAAVMCHFINCNIINQFIKFVKLHVPETQSFKFSWICGSSFLCYRVFLFSAANKDSATCYHIHVIPIFLMLEIVGFWRDI